MRREATAPRRLRRHARPRRSEEKTLRKSDPKKQAKDTVEVTKATVSADKMSVLLELSDRVPAITLRIKCNVKSADGAEVKYQLDNTIHRIPGQKTVAR